MFGLNNLTWVFINSAASFTFLFIISKLLGKKQIAQLEFIDYAVGISLGSIAAEWSTDHERPFYYFPIAMAIFFALAFSVAVIGRKSPFLKRIFKGKPVTLIYDGQILVDGLNKSKIDVNDLLSMLREKGFFNVQDVAFAVFETSGKLSVLPVGDQRPVVIGDIDRKKATRASLTDILVVDGVVSKSGLNELDRDENWLFRQLKIKDKRDLKNVLLATYDEQNKKVVAHYKQLK